DCSQPTTRAGLEICHSEAEYAEMAEHRLRPTLRLELPDTRSRTRRRYREYVMCRRDHQKYHLCILPFNPQPNRSCGLASARPHGVHTTISRVPPRVSIRGHSWLIAPPPAQRFTGSITANPFV
ncbi:hypothetical protein QBC32DRAFT_210846, partial [Pseudoneurospora amorphoporcata]